MRTARGLYGTNILVVLVVLVLVGGLDILASANDR